MWTFISNSPLLQRLTASLLAASMIPFCAQAEDTPPVKVCLVANAGFLIKSDNTSLLLDAVQDKGLPLYSSPSQNTRDKMLAGTPPYDNLKALLSTHFHEDHMGKSTIEDLIKAHPDMAVIMPDQGFEKMGAKITVTEKGRVVRLRGKNEIKTVKTTPSVKAIPQVKQMPTTATVKAIKMIATLPDWNDNTLVLDGKDLQIRSYRISHGRGRPIENIGYLISLNGMRIFHPGDMDTGLKPLLEAGIDGLEVDVLLIPYWYGLDKGAADLVNRAWKAKTIIPMHFDKAESDWMKDYGGLEGVTKAALKAWPNTVYLQKEGECFQLPSHSQTSK